jgi:uncharacterized protein YjbI with pentapeptide repeats
MAGFMRKLMEQAVFGIVAGLAVFLVTWHFESQRADNDQRLENLRFVRERSSDDPSQPRPFRGLDLANQNLSGLRLPQAQFVEADLAKADLRFVLLSGAQLRAADLREARLTQTTLNGTGFIDAQLSHASIDKAFARNASFAGSNLSGADFTGTSLQGADFSGAVGLDQADLSTVCWDESTRWPEGFTPPPSDAPENCPS